MSHSISVDRSDHVDLAARLDAVAPWMASVVFHLGIGLLVLFLAWFIIKSTRATISEPIIMPSTVDIDQHGGLPNPGQGDPNLPTAQNLKQILHPDGWGASDSNDLSKSLAGPTGTEAINLIGLGNGGGRPGIEGNGSGSGLGWAHVGPPGGAGDGGLIGVTSGRAAKIVYIIDHSGSLLDNFDFLRDEIKLSVGRLLPVQQFAVVAFSEDAQVLGPPQLQRATAIAKHDLDKQVDDLKAEGQNDSQLLPFQHAFEKAFAMKPDLIYFLTDGAFDPKLTDIVKKLNADHKVRINTLAFINADPEYETQLKDLAKQNGGVYKFVKQEDLGK